MEENLTNFIKYCLGYVKLTRQRTFAAQQKYSVNLPKEYLGLTSLLNADIEKSGGELINLKTFYSYDPKEVTKDLQEDYEEEKVLANKIDEIRNKHKNDQFTKQIMINFGYLEIEIPIEIEESNIDIENEDIEDNKVIQIGLFEETAVKDKDIEKLKKSLGKIDRYPLFSLSVKIEKIIGKGVGRYFVYPVDTEVQVNVGMLETTLGEDLYYQLLDEIGRYEVEERFTLPISEKDIFIEIWHKIKAQLKLKEAKFGEDSFSLEEMRLALSPRANYFLAEDLQKLSKLNEEELKGTALTSWVEDDELNVRSDLPNEKDLYFPFLYDKYQLRVLSIINNKAAIVQGPPGTGKSETIANVLCHLAATGKRVLFVSQKTQALKVVKDKLKKLDIKYLFGYIPNPSSTQIGEEDEIDGIAPQLTALDSYIEKIGYTFNEEKSLFENSGKNANSLPSLATITEEKTKLKTRLTTPIEDQREYYQLHEELKMLQDYDIPITDISRFEKTFSHAKWQEIKSLKINIETLVNVINKYEKTKQKKEFDNIFSSLNLQGRKYTGVIQRIREDVAKSGYDRHSKLRRKVNNFRRNLRLRKERSRLPREIINYIDHSLGSDISRNQAEKILESLSNYCRYYENTTELEVSEDSLLIKLNTSGMADQEFQIIDSFIANTKSGNLDEIKQNILRVKEIKELLKVLGRSEDTNYVASELRKVDKTRSECITSYIQNIINQKLIGKCKIITIWRIIKKLAKILKKSRKAFKTFDNLRKDPEVFNTILDLIPVWIMELDDASRIIPPKASIFDYVILDESSQCNVAYTLPVMFRSKRALFVGDSEQMRDNTIIFKSNKLFDDLAHRYRIPEEFRIKTTGTSVQSVLDIAGNRFGLPITLQYYYRSPAELIGFSNKYFYKPKGKELIPLNNNYLTYKNTNKIMLIHDINSDWSEEFSDKVNVAEAKAILKLFRDLRTDERCKDKSVGILSFFNAQATYIRELFEQEGYKEEEDNYKISIIEGIQGDEKDIVFTLSSSEPLNKRTNTYL